jgi:hypothetical protein
MDLIKSISRFIKIVRKALAWMFIYISLGVLLVLLGKIFEHNDTFSIVVISIGSSLIAIGCVPVVVEVYTSWHILSMMRLYGDHKQHGILRVFANPKDPEFLESYEIHYCSAKRIKILSLIGRRYFEDNEARTKTLEKAKEVKEFKILVCEVGSDGWNHQYDFFEPSDDHGVSGKTKSEEWSNSHNEIKKRLAEINSKDKGLRFYKSKPVFNFSFFDDFLYVSFYGKGSRAIKNSPILLFEKRSASEVIKYFETQFENYWG